MVTGSAGCTVTAEENGETRTLLTLEKDGQGTFAAIGDEVEVSDDKALLYPFASAPASALGGGGGGGADVADEELLKASVGLDSLAAGPGAVAYCADSLAIGLGAVVGATYASKSKTATATRQKTDAASETNNTSSSYSSNSVAIGLHAQASGFRCTAYGNFATAGSRNSTASGYSSTASGYYSTASGSSSTASGYYSTASGYYSTASGYYSTAIGAMANVGSNGVSSVAVGAGAYVNDAGVVALNAGGGRDFGGVGYSTQLYIITKGSSLANTYLRGEAGLGYIVIDHVAGSVVARGVIPLASICTEHTSDFEPTGYANIEDY